MTEPDVIELLLLLEDHYDEPHDDDREARWVRALAGTNTSDVRAAARGYMADEPRWFPKPAQLLAMVPDRLPTPVLDDRPKKPAGEFPGFLIPDHGGCWMVPKEGPIPPRVIEILDQARAAAS